jgi:tRNA G18 (ribose-2'-O)-methylase SpoU
MNAIDIQDVDDPRIAEYRELPKSATTRRSRHFIAEGFWVVERLLTSKLTVTSLLVSEGELARVAEIVLPEIPVYVASKSGINEIIGFRFHRGVLACAKRPDPLSIGDVVPPIGSAATLAAFPQTVDPENLAVSLRACAAFGVQGVLLGAGCADPFSRRVVRVSMATVLSLPIVESSHLLADLRQLRERDGFESIATVLDPNATPLAEIKRNDRTVLLFGGEARGLPREYIEQSSQRVTIPMRDGIDSLNVATSVGVALYHFQQIADGRI